MNRPSRQMARLLEKISRKESRTAGKRTKRVKQWRKWIEAYKSVATDLPAPNAS